MINTDMEMRRFINIVEAPISNISFQNSDPNFNFEDGLSFDDKEKKFLQIPAYQERIIKAFRKTPHNFEIIFRSSNDIHYTDNVSSIIGKFGIYKNYEDIHGEAGKIKVVILANLSDFERVPMTPWILAHKIGHGLQDSFSLNDKWKDFSEVIASAMISGNDDESLFAAFTFKSAKAETIVDDSEAVVECVAQYLIQGKIKFNHYAKKYEEAANKMITTMFNSIDGKVIVEG